MRIDFTDIDSYMPYGNQRQKSAYQTLSHHRIMECLNAFDPLLTGTVPIGIDITGSDLDIICCFIRKEEFISSILKKFSKYENLKICENTDNTVTANFIADSWPVEIFGDTVPSLMQNAFRHMLIEQRILNEQGEQFRRQIIKLKIDGMKTEPAFATLLGFDPCKDPYSALLNYK